MEDIEIIKTSLPKIEHIEKTVNSTNLKVCKMETKLNQLENKVNEVESAVSFLSNESDTQRVEIDKTKTEIKKMKMSCNTIEYTQHEFIAEKERMNNKITEL